MSFLYDIGSPLEKISNSFKSLFSSQKTPLKTVYKAPNKKEAESKKEKQASNQKQIDAILDKISTSGYDSLSDTEKEFLFRAGKDS